MPRSSSILALSTLVAYASVLLVPCLQLPPQLRGISAPIHAEPPIPTDPHAAHHGAQEPAPVQEPVHPPTHAQARHPQAHGHAQDDAPAEAQAHAAHAHGAEVATAVREAAEHGSAPCEVRAVCSCGCDGTPKATQGSTRVPWGIAAALPILPDTPEHALGSGGLLPLPGAPSASIDHVPIPA